MVLSQSLSPTLIMSLKTTLLTYKMKRDPKILFKVSSRVKILNYRFLNSESHLNSLKNITSYIYVCMCRYNIRNKLLIQ